MSFIEPLFLFGILAALIPILVHLINRKKAVRQVFGPMRFLLQSHQKKAPGFKAKQFLLMSIRVLLVMLLALALAKPFFLSASGLTSSERLPAATAIVIDNSFSMEASWEDAKSALEKELSSLRNWDELVIITTNPTHNSDEKRKLSDNKNAAKKYARSVLVSKEKGELASAIEIASDILASSELPNKRIAVISDFAKGGFPNTRFPQSLNVGVDAYKIQAKSIENVAITSIHYEREGDFRDRIWRISVTAKNFGKKLRKEKIELSIQNKVIAGAEIEISPGDITTHVFRHPLTAKGSVKGFVRLENHDIISFDDTRYFTIQLHEKVRVLVVNGEPNSVIYRDETFFLERALNPRGAIKNTFDLTLTTREGFETIHLKKYDVIVMANVSRISSPLSKRLESFVRKGGGLFIGLGDQVDTASYNQHLATLLPKPLRGLKRLALRGDPDAPVKITYFGSSLTQHPIFRVFNLPGGTTLREVEIFSYMLLEPSPPEQSTTLLSYKDNAPALLERKVDRGKVVVLTTSIDDEWSDLPFRTSFLPLMRRIVQHLAKRVTSAETKENKVGETIVLDIGSLMAERIIIKSPTKKRFVLKAVENKIHFLAKEPGVYSLWVEDAKLDEELHMLNFSVNFDVEECDLKRINDAQFKEWTSSKNFPENGNTKNLERRLNIWPWLLFIVTMMLLMETIISTRQSILRKLWTRFRF